MKVLKSVHGHDVHVQHSVSKSSNHLHVIEITAVCGKTIETSRITIGAVDGPRPAPPSKEILQTTLDHHRQRVADEASWKEAVRENIVDLD